MYLAHLRAFVQQTNTQTQTTKVRLIIHSKKPHDYCLILNWCKSPLISLYYMHVRSHTSITLKNNVTVNWCITIKGQRNWKEWKSWFPYVIHNAGEELWIRDGVTEIGLDDVGSQTLGGFVGHLDPVLQHGHGEVGGGVAGQPETEVWVDGFRIQLLVWRNKGNIQWYDYS